VTIHSISREATSAFHFNIEEKRETRRNEPKTIKNFSIGATTFSQLATTSNTKKDLYIYRP